MKFLLPLLLLLVIGCEKSVFTEAGAEEPERTLWFHCRGQLDNWNDFERCENKETVCYVFRGKSVSCMPRRKL